MADEKVWTVNDTMQMVKDRRTAAPAPAPAPDAAPVTTVDDVKRMLKGLPPLTEEEKAAAMAAPITGDPEKELEAETGLDVEKTSSDPPTYVVTDKPATAGVPKGKPK